MVSRQFENVESLAGCFSKAMSGVINREMKPSISLSNLFIELGKPGESKGVPIQAYQRYISNL